MTHVYSDEEGEFLVRLARSTVDQFVSSKEKMLKPRNAPDHLLAKSGVFVTLNAIAGDRVSLRGCIGRPYPTHSLVQATIDSAIDAAANDPRFAAVGLEELDKILVELSVLTPPVKIEYAKPEELLEKVKVGRDGLIVERGGRRGLLLPQVPVDWGWDVRTFLEHTCEKAWLLADQWKDPKTEFMSFQAEIFGEKTPRGEVIRNPSHARM